MVETLTSDLKVDVGTWVAVRSVPGKRIGKIREMYYKVKDTPLTIPKASVLEFIKNIRVEDMPENELKDLAIRSFGPKAYVHVLKLISTKKTFAQEYIKTIMMVPVSELMGVEGGQG